VTGDVTRCFQKLKPRERALLWLAYVEGCAHGEIAGTLDLSEKSVRVLLFRARRNLERILRQNGLSEVNP
jgi:RNA polymerase sigma-70 factor (ECF subfamily)